MPPTLPYCGCRRNVGRGERKRKGEFAVKGGEGGRKTKNRQGKGQMVQGGGLLRKRVGGITPRKGTRLFSQEKYKRVYEVVREDKEGVTGGAVQP